jgi:hypothetical protein
MALDFDAANEEYVEIGDVAPLDIAGDQITVAAWVKIASKTAEKKVIAKWSDSAGAFSYLLTISGGTDDVPTFVVNTGGNVLAIATTNLATGTWYHLAGIYDGANVKIYVNGVEEDSTADTGNINSTTAPIRIGMGSGTPPEEPMDGTIDDVRIYDRGLSPDEILTIFSSEGVDGIIQNLQGRWVMDEDTSGDTASGAGSVKDIGPNGLNGTPTNTPTYATGQLRFRRKQALA